MARSSSSGRLTGLLISISIALFMLMSAAPVPAAAQGGGPPPPGGLQVFDRQEDLGLRVTLSWNIQADVAGYRVYRANRPDGPYIEAGTVSTFSMGDFPFFLDEGITPGRTYYYRVAAIDATCLEGPMSATVEANPPKYFRAAGVEKSILVSLGDQRVYFFENGEIVNILRCSTGAGGTPTGDYHIMAHSGWVSGCAYWMDWRPNYGMHAWPSYLGGYEENLGVNPMSHGCVRLHPLEAWWPYNWAPDGTPFTVIGGEYMALPYAGASCSNGATAPSKTWYFPEGYTGDTFKEYIALFNPTGDLVTALATYYVEGMGPVEQSLTLPPSSRYTINVNQVPGVPAWGHSTKIEASAGIVAQQSEYFDYNGRRGGHSSLGVPELSNRWYFAEGYTGDGFDTYLLLCNPRDVTAEATVTYFPEAQAACFQKVVIPPFTRYTIHVNEVMAWQPESFKVESNEPIAAERTMYFSYGIPYGINGGDAAVGVTEPATEWYLAEGSTADYFSEYILIMNPNREPVLVNGQFYSPDGGHGWQYCLGPESRCTIVLDSIPGMEDIDAAAYFQAEKPVIVERTMYYGRDSRRGGHASVGSSRTSKDWYFAEGCTAGSFDEYILVFNPGDEASLVNFIFHTEAGEDVGCQYAVPAKDRITLHADDIPGVEWTGSAVEIHSEKPVVAEQSQYFCMPR